MNEKKYPHKTNKQAQDLWKTMKNVQSLYENKVNELKLNAAKLKSIVFRHYKHA